MKYTIFGIEEVYDEFDEYEYANPLTPVVVRAFSVEKARRTGYEMLREVIQNKREGFWSSGSFIPRVTQIVDRNGYLVFQDTSQLVRGWPFPSDERSLAKEKIPYAKS